jgi:hypothetical protein
VAVANDEGRAERTGDFASEAERGNAGLLREIWELIRFNKKWWLVPVIVALLVVGAVLLLSTGAAAPFLYPLF